MTSLLSRSRLHGGGEHVTGIPAGKFSCSFFLGPITKRRKPGRMACPRCQPRVQASKVSPSSHPLCHPCGGCVVMSSLPPKIRWSAVIQWTAAEGRQHGSLTVTKGPRRLVPWPHLPTAASRVLCSAHIRSFPTAAWMLLTAFRSPWWWLFPFCS